MQAILRLDLAGQPRGWLTLQETISAYARGDVIYGIGDPLPTVYGGIQRLTGHRSTLVVQPIIATEGKVYDAFTPPLCNRTLFKRDDHRCLYCGNQSTRSQLTRDHVLPALNMSRSPDGTSYTPYPSSKSCEGIAALAGGAARRTRGSARRCPPRPPLRGFPGPPPN